MSPRPHVESAPQDTTRNDNTEKNGEMKKQPEEKRDFKLPVAWLLGRELLASFKGMLVFMAFGSKLDARDWMNPSVYPATDPAAADDAWRRLAVESPAADEAQDSRAGRDEFWFDYISDTGDGMRATYSIAYLSMCDLWAAGKLEDLQGAALPRLAEQPRGLGMLDIGRMGFIAHRSDIAPEPDEEACEAITRYVYSNRNLNCTGEQVQNSARTALPRGQFLLVGGDTTYHLSDYESLHKRFQNPFKWAYEDVARDGRQMKTARRPLFGIPGNHDYYDQLDGFRRQFRKPVRPDRDLPPGHELEGPQLGIPGFTRHQEASYVALRLPFGWNLWGLGTELGKIDERQRDFFRRIPVKDGKSIADGAQPDKLIVATCAPTTVFGKYADRDNERSAKAFYQLGLPRPFVKPAEEDEEDLRRAMKPGQCRLDLSGDVHLYARYWGRGRSGPGPRGGARPEERPHYASVVSGLGGAFHHPTTTYAGEVCEQALYPPPERSRRAVAAGIFNPLWIMVGGGVWAIGFLIAFLLYYALNLAQSSSTALTGFGAVSNQVDVQYWIGAALPLAWLVLAVVIVLITRRFYRKYWMHEEVVREAISAAAAAHMDGEAAHAAGASHAQHGARAGQGGARDCEWYEGLMRRFNLFVYPLVLLSVAALAGAILLLAPYKYEGKSNWSFGNSLLVLFTLVWAGWATYLALRYTDWLDAMASKITITGYHWVLVWLLGLPAAVGVVAGFAIFGRGNSAADTLTDMLVTLVVTAVIAGLIGLGAYKFGEVKSGWSRFWHGVLGFFMGLFHAALQLALPYLLVSRAAGHVWAVTGLLLVAAQVSGWLVMRGRLYKLLPVAWLFFGGLMLLPYISWGVTDPVREAVFGPVVEAGGGALPSYVSAALNRLFEPSADSRWNVLVLNALVLCVFAGVVGLVMSCVWVGWYFATALVYNGHNNEAGGAARIERFKQFVRFRLTKNDLTGFVIAVDYPQKDGRELEPRLVDVIYLTPMTAPEK